ncbi:MAG: carboxypeptidase-like regulatory domain-containing protein [Planctomycetota bacterium]
MRPSVVLPLVLAAIAALAAVLFFNGPDESPTPEGDRDLTTRIEEPQVDRRKDPLDTPDLAETREGGNGATESARRGVEPETPTAAVDAPNGACSLAVTVLGEEGAPLENAIVGIAIRQPGAELNKFLAASGNVDPSLALAAPDRTTERKTKADGTALFPELTPSPYYAVVVSHPDYAPSEVRQLPVVANGGKPTTVTVTLEHGLMVHGYVRNEAGEPLPNAQLALFPTAALNLPLERQVEFGKGTKTNSEGYYRFQNVDVASLNCLIVRRSGYGSQAQTDIRPEGFDTSIEVDFRLAPGLSIRGRVVSASGAPVAGADVTAYGLTNIHTSRGTGKSKADGTFELLDIVEGPYQVRALAPGWAEAREPRVDAGEQNLVLEMQPLGQVTGNVVDSATGRPVTAFTVSVRRSNQGNQVLGPPFMQKSYSNAAEGAYEITGIPEGVYAVQADAPGYAPSLSKSFEVRLGEVASGIEVRISTGGGISGRIVDQETGQPVKGAKISTQDNGFVDNALAQMFGAMLSRRTTSRAAVSDADGRFSLTNLAPGDYQLKIEHPDYTTTIVKDLRIEDTPEPIDFGNFFLRKGGAVNGVVYDENGAPMKNATVTLANTDIPGLTYQVRSDDEGRYSVGHVAPGGYRIHAQRPVENSSNPFEALLDVQRSERELFVDEGGEHYLDLSMVQ